MSRIWILANFDVGLYKFRKELIQKLMDEGNEISVSLPQGELIKNLQQMGCRFLETPVDRRGINPVTDLKLFCRYLRILRVQKPDLVITYTIKPNIYGGLACRFTRVPYCINITGLGTAFQKEGILKKMVTLLYCMACKKARVVFFENAGNLQTFRENRIIRKEQACLLNGAGINLEEYPFAEYPPEDPPEYLPESPKQPAVRFLFVGRVMKEKGVEELFQATEALQKKGIPVELDVVGPYEDDYKQKVEELVERKVIRFHDYQEDVKPFIANCHCFVLPSWHEGMANTLLECASMGRPLITSRVHGCMEAVEENKNGLLVNAEDSDDLQKKMELFVKIDYNKKKQMGLESRRIAEEKFDKRVVVEKTVEGLEE